MSDVPDLDAAGLPEELSPFDQILHRGEANPRTRSGVMTLEILDSTPEWDRFRARFENASRKVLRLRQKVVIPTLPTAAPRWVVDPDFNLDFHVRRMRIPEPGTLRQLLISQRSRRNRRSTFPGRCGRSRLSKDSTTARPR